MAPILNVMNHLRSGEEAVYARILQDTGLCVVPRRAGAPMLVLCLQSDPALDPAGFVYARSSLSHSHPDRQASRRFCATAPGLACAGAVAAAEIGSAHPVSVPLQEHWQNATQCSMQNLAHSYSTASREH